MEKIYTLNEWDLSYHKYDPSAEKHTEALCTLGNGFMGTRGAHEEAVSSDAHYAGTYIAGVYNRLYTRIAGKTVDNEDLVNCPDWTAVTFRIGSGPWFDIDKVEVLDYLKQLDLKRGLLNRSLRVKDKQGRITTLISQRLVSMQHANLCALSYSIIPENYDGTITIRSGLNGKVINDGVDRYRQLKQQHLKSVCARFRKGTMQLAMKTTESGIQISEAAREKVYLGALEIKKPEAVTRIEKKAVYREYKMACQKQKPVCLEKVVAVRSSTEPGRPGLPAAEGDVLGAGSYSAVRARHISAWRRIWERINIEIEGGEQQARVLRLHSYHMLTCASPFNKVIDASIPARGLHGEAYHGHIFWDDLFVQPFFASHYPEVARSLLMYRVRRVGKARQYARENGYKGAMFPWQSGSDGREETQVIHLNPVSGKWGDDYSRRQRHVSHAVFHDLWEYCHVTGDKKFLAQYAATVMFEIARFWVSLCRYKPETRQYEIAGVMGPDEFHEKLPGSKEMGLKDNAYTNIMAAWALERCFEVMEMIPAAALKRIKKAIRLSDKELKLWEKVSTSLGVIVKNGIVSQFNGYMDLKELDWERYKKKYGNIGRMDRLLKAEGLSPDSFKLSKQADFLMLFYMLPLEEITAVFKRLGYSFDLAHLKKNYNYYLKRTSHGSTLSYVVHTYVAALLGNVTKANQWFNKTLGADLDDIQGGTTKEGIHVGLMGGTIALALRAFAGVDTTGPVLKLNPGLPARWKKISFSLTFKGVRYQLAVTPSQVTVSATGGSGPAAVIVGKKRVSVTSKSKSVNY